MEKLLILNPGSTSTKIGVFEGETPLFIESIDHSPEELAPFDHVAEQYEFRKELVVSTLEKHGVALDSLSGIVSRGGLLTPIQAGAYEINDDMVWQLKNKPQNEHASNVGAMIARAISVEHNMCVVGWMPSCSPVVLPTLSTSPASSETGWTSLRLS